MTALRPTFILLSMFMFMFTSLASAKTDNPVVIAIMDYGINTKDARLKDKVYINKNETSRLNDSDKNGFDGDREGWNRATQNGELYSSIGNVRPYLDIIYELNNLTQESLIRKLTENEVAEGDRLEKSLPPRLKNSFHSNLHGQHVVGIALKDTQNTLIVPVTFTTDAFNQEMATQSPLAVSEAITNPNYKVDPFFMLSDIPQKLFALKEIRVPLYPIVQNELNFLKPSFEFLKTRPIRVVNMSFTSGLRSNLTGTLLELWQDNFKSMIKEEYLQAYVHSAQKYASMHLYSWMTEQREKLFVQAAGNTEGELNEDIEANNNDLDPMFPTSVSNWFDAPNLIVVAATVDRASLAPFSAYGDKSVDVAAPGYRISSYTPQGGEIELSGTSMAAPYVTNTAAKMLEVNPHLHSTELKNVIMGTVDKKDFLKGKVKSEGIVNPVRAIKAAKLAIKFGIKPAIEMARKEIQDLSDETTLTKGSRYSGTF